MKRNNNFFTGFEDEDIIDNELVDQNVDEDGEIEPVITETDVPEDGKSPESDVVSVEDFNHFFGLEDDEIVPEDDDDDEDDVEEEEKTEAPTINVSVDVDTGSDDEEDEIVEDAADEEGAPLAAQSGEEPRIHNCPCPAVHQ